MKVFSTDTCINYFFYLYREHVLCDPQSPPLFTYENNMLEIDEIVHC